MTAPIAQPRPDAAIPHSPEAAAYIAALEQQIANQADYIKRQQTIMDRAASIMLEACLSDDGIDTEAADQCMDATRNVFKEVGKTTTEQLLQTLYDHICAAAGFPPGTECDPLHVLHQMRTTMAVQAGNAACLEALLKLVWTPGTDKEAPRLQVSLASEPIAYRSFPIGTQWPEALQAIMSKPALALAA
jgi:hypothetical protein